MPDIFAQLQNFLVKNEKNSFYAVQIHDMTDIVICWVNFQAKDKKFLSTENKLSFMTDMMNITLFMPGQ